MDKRYFDFNDINLIPKKCIVESRSECDTKAKLGKYYFKLPVMPANMKAVIDESLAVKLAKNNYFYVMHRFDIDTLKFVENMKSKNLISSISIGVNQESYKLIDLIKKTNLIPEYITVDIAHGHAVKMEKMLKYLRDKLGNDIFIIAGNVGTVYGAENLKEWGTDAVKIGIGPSSVCTTYPETGYGTRGMQAYSIYEIANNVDIRIIADGGIRTPGDIAKAMVLGSDMIMIGGMLSGFIDSPGTVIEKDGKKYKEFFGSASIHNGDKKNRIEGKHVLVDLKDESIITYLKKIEESLQSAISYGGGNKLEDLYSVRFINKNI